MDKMYKVPSSKTPSETHEDMIADVAECYICRDVALVSKGKLRKFCDCKSLLAHHVCLSTWIHKGFGSEDRLRCGVCNAEYRLRRHHPCRVLLCWWQTWLLLLLACVLLGLVPYVVYCMTALNNPPPHTTFKLAAVLFGVLAETLLMKCVSSYLCSRYRLAKMSAVTALV